MSEVRVNNLSNENNTGGPTISGITTYSGTNFFVPPQGDTASRPSSCPPGSLRFNTDSAKLEYYRGDTIGWVEVEAELTAPLGGGTGSNTGLGHRGLYKTSQKSPSSGTYSKEIDFLTISTLGNAVDFGDVAAARLGNGALSSRTRGIFGAAYGPSDQIEFVTIATTGNAIDFGDLTAPGSIGNDGAASDINGGLG